MKVYISPSNQPGNKCRLCCSEKSHCEALARMVAPHLTKAGVTVKIGTKVGVTNRVREATAWGADLYVPIHTNASVGHKVRGTRFGYFPGRTDSRSACLAFVKRWKTAYPGDVRTALYAFHEARAIKCPGAYVELVFHDNLDDAAWLHGHMELAALTLAHCILDALKLQEPPKLPYKAKVNTLNPLSLNIWKGPNKAGKTGTKIPRGKVIEIAARSGVWGLTSYKGVSGWVDTGFLKNI